MSDSKIRLLLVEDDRDHGEVMKLVFESENFEVSWAENGLEGLALAEQNPPAVIVCDYMMPKMNGQEFIVEIKKKDNLKDVPIAVLTAITNDTAEEALRTAGANAFISKTAERKKILETVKSLLN